MFDLKFKPDRPFDILASNDYVLASYTLDRNYIYSYELVGEPYETRRVLPRAHVLALNPTSGKVVPNFTSYGLLPVGVLLEDADAEYADPVVDVIFRGDVFYKSCWDDGVFGDVLQATKDALSDRIHFVRDIGGLVEF